MHTHTHTLRSMIHNTMIQIYVESGKCVVSSNPNEIQLKGAHQYQINFGKLWHKCVTVASFLLLALSGCIFFYPQSMSFSNLTPCWQRHSQTSLTHKSTCLLFLLKIKILKYFNKCGFCGQNFLFVGAHSSSICTFYSARALFYLFRTGENNTYMLWCGLKHIFLSTISPAFMIEAYKHLTQLQAVSVSDYGSDFIYCQFLKTIKAWFVRLLIILSEYLPILQSP